ncbi:MAG: Pyridoxal 5-phosphate (PLP)-dependent ornithine decarboxylase [uncultured Solirubrobacteraceae bacterium]|uniref:ornithine decarboxylase n=1 Tax=uncultured Solirubrobacteraceae bacterium TaxID=1162706 RepID=A0A6J4RLZ0_9ACTN|nr:MAG: Pyridoxal 5-phosphate (PLP)-dependent ornithine decarboxylase [uncultured Solirubrobacteraceae bacterium]
MRLAVADHLAQLRLPTHWPASLAPDALARLDHQTPYLMCDLDVVRDRYARLQAAMPGVDCHYAVKCNPSPEILRTLADAGSSFEIASAGELAMLTDVGVDPADVLYSNPVKPARHIAAAHAAGLWRFVFDSEGELYKLAEHAPGAAVYVRLRVDDSASIFPLSRKFGAEAHEARALMQLASSLGLRPYGITFHVGSQCTSPSAWRQAIAAAGRLMARLLDDGIRIEMLNVSGGLPAHYVEPIPGVEQIASVIVGGLSELLPYRPPVVVCEPGRYLVAESGVMVCEVLGREVRAGENWLYVDVGAYHGLMETQQGLAGWRYPLWTSRPDHAEAYHEPFTVTGPSCDSSDTIFFGASLPATIDVDDKLYIGSAGAYTLSYASHFNGFPPPTTHFVEGA